MSAPRMAPRYCVTLERTRTVNAIRPKGGHYTYTLIGPATIEAAREHVQRTDCDYNRPWRIFSIEPIGGES